MPLPFDGNEPDRSPLREPLELTAETLDDLHAGLLSASQTAQAQELLVTDVDAVDYLQSLNRVDTALAALRCCSSIEPIPATTAARIHSQLVDRSPRYCERQLAAAAALTVVAVASAAIVWGGVALRGSHTVAAESVPTAVATTAAAYAIPSSAIHAALGKTDLGVLANPNRRAECLAANGFTGPQHVVGASDVDSGGVRGILLLLAEPGSGGLTALVVGPGCSTGHPELLARQRINP